MVLLVLGILISAFKSFFNPQNQDVIYSQSCVNSIHGTLNNFLNAAMTSKNLYTTESVSPDIYTILIDQDNETISLDYNTIDNSTS